MNAAVAAPSRRGFLAGSGALVVSFASRGPAAIAAEGPSAVGKQALSASFRKAPFVDSWIRIDASGTVTVLSGKAEIGQGIRTALLQVAGEELDVDPRAIRLITADTDRTADEGYTAGSHSMQDSATAIRQAAAQARSILVARAAERLGATVESLSTREGTVIGADGRRIAFGDLIGDAVLHVEASPDIPRKEPDRHTLVGTSFPRVDIPGKVAGGRAYLQDMRLKDMVHGRTVRPPSHGARLRDLDVGSVARMPGVVKVVRDGDFLGVLAEKEFQAITAMKALATLAEWDETAAHPEPGKLFEALEALPAERFVDLDKHAPAAAPVKTLQASFRRHYQLHGSVGPSCGIALMEGDRLTVWSHAQGMFPLREAVSQMVGLPREQVRCIHVEGSGCYGHNGADDAAADAVILARATPGRAVRVQQMREQENVTEPYGPAMTTRVSAALDADGTIVDWQFTVRSNTHNMRPGNAGSLLAGRLLEKPFTPPPPAPLPLPEGGGDRNAIPLYDLPNVRILHDFVPDMPLRVSAMRGLGAYMNVFSIESFMEELAVAADQDPVAFRLKHMKDARARDVIALAAERYGWSSRRSETGRLGHGFAFARYKNLGAYAAIAAEVETVPETGRIRLRRAVAAVDSGEAVNPDGIRNQIEGGILQSASWTLYEKVTFDRTRITSRDWSTYPILRFEAVPETVEVHIIDRPGQPFLGTGEASHGPTAAAIANAVADALGERPRELPLLRPGTA